MGSMWRYRFRRTTLMLVFCLALLGGVGLAHTGLTFGVVWVWITGLCVVLWLRQRTPLALALVVLFGICCGCWRGAIYMQKLDTYQGLYFQKISLTARAIDDGVYGTN